MLFVYPQIKNDMDRILNNWLNHYDLVEPAMNLYFSFKRAGQKYLEGKFLALAQGLETYDRRKWASTSTDTLRKPEEYENLKSLILSSCPENEKKWLENMLENGNQINFRKRLKRMVEPFKTYIGNSNQRDALIEKIYDTRNYLTHYSQELEEKSAKGKELWTLCRKMEAIFQLNFLNDLGFSAEQIAAIHEKSISKLLKD